MGTAFGSSLLGLSGSLVVGLLELFASHAQNRFYRELEEWLSSITKHRHRRRRARGGADRGQRADGDRPDRRADRRAARDASRRTCARSAETEAASATLVELLGAAEARAGAGGRQRAPRAHRLGAGAGRRICWRRASGEGGGLDAETRARLRSIDTQVLRILDDLAAGRQDLVTEIRQDIAGLADALRGVGGAREVLAMAIGSARRGSASRRSSGRASST